MNFSVILAAAVAWRGSINWKSQPSIYIYIYISKIANSSNQYVVLMNEFLFV